MCGDGLNINNGITDCDDKNYLNGDGCSSTCDIEDGWYCYGGSINGKDTCYEECGDDYDRGKFTCELGDDNDDDPAVSGCSTTCTVNEGWYCYGGSGTTLDTCYDDCGDNVVVDGDPTTYCDTTDEGCSNTC